MVKSTENVLNFNRINEDDISRSRIIKLRDRTVYEFEKININPKNPNSSIKALFQDIPNIDKGYSAASAILMSLLKEPIFN